MSIERSATEINGVYVAEFLAGYVTAMLWSTTDQDTGGLLNDRYSALDLADETRERIDVECRAFLYRAGMLITGENWRMGGRELDLAGRAGHDFWLTRCGHGAGFWDGDWRKPAGDTLSIAARDFGALDPYASDDGRIYF